MLLQIIRIVPYNVRAELWIVFCGAIFELPFVRRDVMSWYRNVEGPVYKK
jgi:hypothetical protein